MNYKDFKFETERLRCEIINQSYAEDIFNSFTSEITTYMYPCPAKKIEETIKFIDDSMKKAENKTTLVFVILDKDNGDFFGCMGLHYLDKPAPEIGIWLKKEAHGNAYGREAATEMVKWSKEQLGINKYIYPVDKRNISSRKIPESLCGKIHKEYEATGLAENKMEMVEYFIEL